MNLEQRVTLILPSVTFSSFINIFSCLAYKPRAHKGPGNGS